MHFNFDDNIYLSELGGTVAETDDVPPALLTYELVSTII